MLGVSSCKNDKLPISFIKSNADYEMIGAAQSADPKKIDQKSTSVSNMIGMLSDIAYIIANTLGVVMNSGSTTSWPGYDNMIGMLVDFVYSTTNTLQVVMTSGQTSTQHDHYNTIGMLSDKFIDIPGVVMTDGQNQADITDGYSTIVKMTALISLTLMMYAVITYIMGIMIKANAWATSFITTAVRLGVCVAYIAKDITILVAKFIVKFIYASAMD